VSAYRLHYFPESGNSDKLALMLTSCGQSSEPVCDSDPVIMTFLRGRLDDEIVDVTT
jgi:hypothetical protein